MAADNMKDYDGEKVGKERERQEIERKRAEECESTVEEILAKERELDDHIKIHTDDIIAAKKSLLSSLTNGGQSPVIEGLKDDREKLRWELMPWVPLQEVVKVLMYGSKKYSDHNWQKVENGGERYFAAAMRHLIAYRTDTGKDPETGLSHLAHCMCCLLFMMWFDGKEGK